MSRTRIGIAVLILLVAGALAWIILADRDSHLKTSVASANGSNYKLELPGGMLPDQLNENASIQYSDESSGISFFIIDDSKEKIASFGLDYDLETYMKISTRTLDSTGLHVNSRIEVGGHPALQTEIDGKHAGKDCRFILTCIETPTFYYRLVIWSPSEKFEANKGEMDALILSFSEENGVVKK
ncbi:MAG: hypothetical protein L6Q81_04420 [Bacteroidia bacterium]|nr:hypothetical protein [Bacteroidia bacterium]